MIWLIIANKSRDSILIFVDFRHDYLNVLSSIKYGIDSKDIAIISDIYDNILEKTKTRIEGKQYEIANLINIKDEAVKGVLASKILEAQGQSITIHLEVSDVFEVSRMELLDFITVLSIFWIMLLKLVWIAVLKK